MSVVIQLIPNQSKGGQWYSDTSPFSIPWIGPRIVKLWTLVIIAAVSWLRDMVAMKRRQPLQPPRLDNNVGK